MKRGNRSHADAPGVSLFPFLAVLLCTMGALIVLLIVLADQSRKQAASAHSAERRELEQIVRQSEWKQGVLDKARASAAKDLADANNELAYFEDQVRSADEALREVQAAARRYVDLLQGRRSAAALEADQLEMLRAEIAAMQAELEERDEAAPTSKAYTVVPYLGKFGTYRRPVYLDCRADRIIIQPEGVELVDADFIGPLGPSNPLAIVMRATRRLIRQEEGESSLKEPYPLLLVRPDGIGAFYVAREVLANVDVHFGYELIEADWDLRFPSPDPAMEAEQRKALADARAQLRTLVASAPRQFSQDVRSVFAAAVGQEATGAGGTSSGTTNPYTAGGFGDDGVGASDSGFGGEPSLLGGGSQAADESSGLGELANSGTGSGSGGGRAQPQVGLYRAAEASSGQAGRGGGAAAGGPGASGTSPTGSPALAADTSGRSGSGGDASSGGGEATRGTLDWLNSRSRQGAIPVARPVALQLREGRLRFLEGEPTPLAVDDPSMPRRLAEEVGRRIEEWGIAGRGMTWKPELLVHVAPGQEDAYERASQQLSRFGVEVRRAEAAAETRGNPLR